MAIRKSVFNKFLQSLSEEDLRSELDALYTKYKEVKDHYSMELGSEMDRKRVYDQAKKNIAAKYRTKSYRKPKRPRISKVKAILKEMEKITVFKEEMADLYLYNCEVCLEFMDDYCYYSEVIYNNIFTSFASASELIIQSMAEETFAERCHNIIDKSSFFGSRLAEEMQILIEEWG